MVLRREDSALLFFLGLENSSLTNGAASLLMRLMAVGRCGIPWLRLARVILRVGELANNTLPRVNALEKSAAREAALELWRLDALEIRRGYSTLPFSSPRIQLQAGTHHEIRERNGQAIAVGASGRPAWRT